MERKPPTAWSRSSPSADRTARRTGTSAHARDRTGSRIPRAARVCSGQRTRRGQLESFNLYRYAIDSGAGPIFHNGDNQGYSLNLHGGNDITRYYLSSSYDDDIGVVSWNWDKKFAGRANIDVEANKKLRIEGSLGYIRDRIRLAQNGSINPDPFSNLVWGRRSLIPTTGGFGFAPAALWDDVEDHADVDRMTTSVTARYEPFTWFTHRLAVGLDVNSENNWTLYPRETAENATFYGSNGLGAKSVERASRNFLTLDYSGNLKYSLRSFDFTTSMGFQAYRSELSNISASGTTFPASPITTVSGTTTRNATEGYAANATVGLFVQQALAWKNRLFLTAALRGDDNSAFGKDYSAAYYPKVSASWVLSEEPLWKEKSGIVGRVLGDLRLRGAFGAAGTQPGTFDAARLYTSSTGYQNAAGLVPSSFGNPQLKPERSTELELGFETALLDRRMDVSLHALRPQGDRRDRERALAAVRRLPGESGRQHRSHADVGQRARRELPHSAGPSSRVGSRNAARQQRQPHRRPRRWSDLPDGRRRRPGAEPRRLRRRATSSCIRFVRQHSIRRVRSCRRSATAERGSPGSSRADRTRRVRSARSTGKPAPRVFWGHSQPTWQAGLNTQVTLWDNLRLYARVDGNGGHWQSDTEIRALHNQGSTKAVIEQNDPFLQTYRQIDTDAASTYQAGFLRLRELSASYTIKPSLLQKVGASGGSVTFAGRNLSMLWTAEQGWNTSRDGEIYVDVANQHVWDPEIRALGSLANGFQTIMPPTASFVATFRLTY